MTGALTHIGGDGAARMVDVSAKSATARRAVASGRIAINAAALAAVREGNAAKGDVLGVARIAGIMAAKRTAELIPLCHPLALTSVEVDLAIGETGIEVIAVVTTLGPTGAEMEALTAVGVALLTVYDMVKTVDRGMRIEGISLDAKSGGRSGDYRREADTADRA